jgi:hypothetical protein
VIANLSKAPPQLRGDEHRLRYDLGCSLAILGRNAEAFVQAQAIDVKRGGEPLELKTELIDEIACCLKFLRPPPEGIRPQALRVSAASVPENPNRSFTLELELQVLRERASLLRTLQHGNAADPKALLELAALLCRLGSPQQLEEGIETYSSALKASRSITPCLFISLCMCPRIASRKQIVATFKQPSRKVCNLPDARAPPTWPMATTGGLPGATALINLSAPVR